jgi:phosphate-selective porin OprO/OprP
MSGFCLRRLTQVLMASASLAALAHAAAAGEPSGVDDRLAKLGASVTSERDSPETAPSPVATSHPAKSKATKKHRRSSAENAAPPDLSSLRSVEDRLSRLEAAAVAQGVPVAAQVPLPTPPPNDIKVELNNLRPVIKSADGKNELAFRGLLQFDGASYMQDDGDMGAAVPADHRDLGSGAVFRRVRFGVEGKFLQDFVYEMRFEFGATDSEGSGTIDIMRVGYTGIPNLRIHLGALQPIITMADPVPSSELTFLERPSVVTAALPVFGGESGRRGIEATFQKTDVLQPGDNLILSGALTGQKMGSAHSGSSLDDEGTQILGRAAYRLYSDEETNIQVGASAAEVLSLTGTTPGIARTIRFRERPEARVSGERLVDTDNIQSEGAALYGFEAGANFQNVYLGGEWYAYDVDRDRDCAACSALNGDPSFSGWYVEGMWVLTGESRRYLATGTGNNVGVWAGPKPKNPFMAGDGMGALEAMARYSTLDLNWNEGAAGAATPTGGIRGGELSIYSLGLVWYLNANLRIMTDYQWVDVERLNAAGVEAGQDFDVLQGRVQFSF